MAQEYLELGPRDAVAAKHEAQRQSQSPDPSRLGMQEGAIVREHPTQSLAPRSSLDRMCSKASQL